MKKKINFYDIMEAAQDYITEEKYIFTGSSSVYKFVRPVIDQTETECLYVLALNIRNRLIGFEMLFKGAIDHCTVDIRDIFRYLLMKNARRFIVVHNHPSGESSPSIQDITLTENLVKAGNLMGIELLDHVVVAYGYTSLRDLGHVKTSS